MKIVLYSDNGVQQDEIYIDSKKLAQKAMDEARLVAEGQSSRGVQIGNGNVQVNRF